MAKLFEIWGSSESSRLSLVCLAGATALSVRLCYVFARSGSVMELALSALLTATNAVLCVHGLRAERRLTRRLSPDAAVSGSVNYNPPAAKLVETRDKERLDIARELHDDIGQQLTLLVSELGSCAISGQLQPAKISYLRDLSEKALASVRGLARSLRPPVLDGIALAATLRASVQQFEQSSSIVGEVVVLGPEDSRFSADVEIGLYRIFQESLANICKHSAAGTFGVLIDFREPGPRLVIDDDGRGFDMLHVRPGFGLMSMSQRAAELGGRLTVKSKPGGGTTVLVSIPG